MSGVRDRSELYKFGPFTLIIRERLLLRDETVVSITPKAFETLVVLVENGGCVVAKTALLDRVWPDTFVEEKTLAQNILTLRKILGNGDSGQKYIETVPKLGYRFIATVYTHEDTDPVNDERWEMTGLTAPSVPNDSKADRSKRFSRLIPFAITILSILVILILTNRLWPGLMWESKSEKHFSNIKLTSLTELGRTSYSAVSPDGKYLAYVVVDENGTSVWVKQIKGSNPVQILPPADMRISAVIFSPDGRYVLFNEYDPGTGIAVVNQVSMLGGSKKLFLEDVDSPISFSPDGSKVAFVRGYPDSSEWALMIRELATASERKVVSLKTPEYLLLGGQSWSPDGKIIACVRGVSGVSGMRVGFINAETGKITDLPDQSWSSIEGIAWTHGGDGMIVNAKAKSPDSWKQLWYVPYPQGEPRKVTQDLSNYSGVSLSADSKTLVTTQYDVILSIRQSPYGDLSQEREILPFTSGKFSAVKGISVSPTGSLIFGGNIWGRSDIWTVESDGSGLKQITEDDYVDSYPAVSRDGKSIAFLSERGGHRQIWIMDIDGKNRRQLTTGGAKGVPRWSPDGKWIVYTSFEKNPTIWKIPVKGGEPTQVTKTTAMHPDISPDGRLIACYYWDDKDARSKLAVIPFDGGEPSKLFDVPAGQSEIGVRWEPDGNALIYITIADESPKVFRQKLSGGPAERLGANKRGFVIYPDWSKDGKQFFYVHGIATCDAVMIQDLPDRLKTQ